MSDKNELPEASVLFVGQDMDWMFAFRKGMQRFFTFNEKRAEMMEDIEDILKKFKPNLVAITVDTELTITVERLVRMLPQDEKIPVLAVVATEYANPYDDLIKQGADFVVARQNLLSSIRIAQHVMKPVLLNSELSTSKTNYENLHVLYDRIFLDIPDPVCYLQDGLFLNVNPSFIKTFKIPNKEHLQEVTIMNYISLKNEKKLKDMMKLAKEKEVIPPEELEFTDHEGSKISFNVFANKVIYQGNVAIELYLRDSSAGGAGAGGGVDPTTGLPSPQVLRASIRQNQERADNEFLGTWIYLWLENYREVMQKDGFKAAEILMSATAEMTQNLLPSSTEIARMGDDALLIWLAGDKEQTISRFKNLIKNLDELVPENIGRLIHPVTYAGMVEVLRNSTYEDLLSNSCRAVRQLKLGQSEERISEPTSANMTRKEERNIAYINRLIDENRINFLYQPIGSLEESNLDRYYSQLNIVDFGNKENDEDMEMDMFISYVNKFQIGRRLERLKVTQFCQDFLAHNGDQSRIQIYFSFFNDALDDETFPEWLESQLIQTGIKPEQVVIEITLDSANESFSGSKKLIDTIRPLGGKIAISNLARLDDTVNEILTRTKPDIIKLDMNEIDTLEYAEEAEFMTKIKEYADENNITLIVEHIESPAQLSHVFPYDIKFVQGDGMVQAMEKFEFDFSEPLF